MELTDTERLIKKKEKEELKLINVHMDSDEIRGRIEEIDKELQ